MPKHVTKKVILMGGFAAGKTALSSRLVHQRFSSAYLATEEVSIEKKTIFIEEFATHVNLVIWDIGDFSMDMGIPESFLLGAHGIIWVVDLSRPATWIGLSRQIAGITGRIRGVPLLLAGSKFDLVSEDNLLDQLSASDLQPDRLTSARTGSEVDLLFEDMARLVIQ